MTVFKIIALFSKFHLSLLAKQQGTMKYSQTIGIIAALMLIGICFLPWSYIASLNITITGFSAAGTNYGKPGLVNAILCSLMIILFAVPAIWAKRTNFFLAALISLLVSVIIYCYQLHDGGVP